MAKRSVENKLKAAAAKLRGRKIRRTDEPSEPDYSLCSACGYWPHAPDCSTLAAIVKRRQQGFCPECDARIVIERNGEIQYCPNGHMREISGEAYLQLMDASGSGWIRHVLKGDT